MTTVTTLYFPRVRMYEIETGDTLMTCLIVVKVDEYQRVVGLRVDGRGENYDKIYEWCTHLNPYAAIALGHKDIEMRARGGYKPRKTKRRKSHDKSWLRVFLSH